MRCSAMITTRANTEPLSREELTAEVRRLDAFTDWVLHWMDLHDYSSRAPLTTGADKSLHGSRSSVIFSGAPTLR